MKYSFMKCFWIINIYFKTFAISIIERKSTNSEIDDFIRQLLTSRKFDELADVIAEKAVDKIIQFEQGIQGSDIKLKSNYSANNSSNIQEIQTRNRDDPDKQHEESDHEKNKKHDKTPVKKYGKINIQAFMKKELSRSENLSLKYKYLTQKSNKKEENSHKEQRREQVDIGSIMLRNNAKKSRKQSEHEEYLELEEIDNGSETYENNDETSHDESYINERENIEDAAHYYDQSEMTNLYHKKGVSNDYEDMDSQSEDEEVEDQQMYYEANESNHEDDAKNTVGLPEVHQEIKNKTILTGKYENNTNVNFNIIKGEKEEVTEATEATEATENHRDDISTRYKESDENKVNSLDHRSHNKTLNRVRTENGKKYVFQDSEEYSEYLQEYDTVRKNKPVKDFL